jgi:hypothetical protein
MLEKTENNDAVLKIIDQLGLIEVLSKSYERKKVEGWRRGSCLTIYIRGSWARLKSVGFFPFPREEET